MCVCACVSDVCFFCVVRYVESSLANFDHSFFPSLFQQSLFPVIAMSDLFLSFFILIKQDHLL